MNKSLLLGLFMVVGLVGSAHAVTGVRGAKATRTVNFSATAVLACKGPAAVYSVVLSSGAATDFAVLRDSNTANTSSNPVINIPHSTSVITQVTFDPPLQFVNGVSFNTQATDNADSVTCEQGRITNGY